MQSDFFDFPTPAQIGDRVGWQDAVIGNPPFVRYQEHAVMPASGRPQRHSLRACGSRGWRRPGQPLVHSSAFLNSDGRLAMVVPAELLTVQYAEPVRRWLRQRFAAVNLFMFERLQFRDAEEQVVLLVAHGRARAIRSVSSRLTTPTILRSFTPATRSAPTRCRRQVDRPCPHAEDSQLYKNVPRSSWRA